MEYGKTDTIPAVQITAKEQEIKIRKMNSPELSDYLNNLMLENPVLEIEENSTGYTHEDLELRKVLWLESNDFEEGLGYFDTEIELPEKNIQDYAEDTGLHGYLKAQLLEINVTEPVRSVCSHVIDGLDENGYLLATLEDIMTIAQCSEQLALEAVQVVQGMEPLGIGTTSLTDCLCLQLDEEDTLARRIVREYLDDVGGNRVDAVANALSESPELVALAMERIRMLNPKPGSQFSKHERSPYITPDVVMIKFLDEYYVALNEFSYPEIHISEEYQNMLKYTDDPEAKDYIKEKIADAAWLRTCVENRNKLLLDVTKAIIKKQELFFRFGPHYLKLLHAGEIASYLGIDEDAVKQTLKNKYLQSPYGVFPLKYFIEQDSSDDIIGFPAIQEKIRTLIESEEPDDPYTDDNIVQILGQQGLFLSEETVERCREKMGYPDFEHRIFYKPGDDEEEECTCSSHSCGHDHCDCGHHHN